MKPIKCLVTAGPTREYFDPVRYISNPSSGKMGWNIANAAKQKGWDVTLILGPSQLPGIDGATTVRVVSAADMLSACEKYFPHTDILIMSAAVSDVRPKVYSGQKIKKDKIDFNPQLEPTPDILKTLSLKKKSQILVGFAAETHDVMHYAEEKMKSKNLDAIVANTVGSEGSGFASDENKIDLILRSGEIVDFHKASKSRLAASLIDFISAKFFGGRRPQDRQ